jgi:hypothetical protein
VRIFGYLTRATLDLAKSAENRDLRYRISFKLVLICRFDSEENREFAFCKTIFMRSREVTECRKTPASPSSNGLLSESVHPEHGVSPLHALLGDMPRPCASACRYRFPCHHAASRLFCAAGRTAFARLALVVFLVLPLLPDAGLAVRLPESRRLWFVVVIVGAISFGGYALSSRWLEHRIGEQSAATMVALRHSRRRFGDRRDRCAPGFRTYRPGSRPMRLPPLSRSTACSSGRSRSASPAFTVAHGLPSR